MSQDSDWQRRFLALYTDAFDLARRRLERQPLKAGEVITWSENGERINDRAFDLFELTVNGNAVIQGAPDGKLLELQIMTVPAEHIVRASDMLEIVIDLGHQHGLCECHARPATSGQTVTMH